MLIHHYLLSIHPSFQHWRRLQHETFLYKEHKVHFIFVYTLSQVTNLFLKKGDMLYSPTSCSKCSWWRRQQYQPGIFLDDPLLERASSQCFHGRKPGQCTHGFRSVDRVHYVHLVRAYLLLCVNTLHICFCFRLLSRSSQLPHPGRSLPTGTSDRTLEPLL